MTREEAIKKLEDTIEYRDRVLKEHDVSRNALCEALDMAVAALREQEELARNSHDVASCEQVTEPLRPKGYSDSEGPVASKNQVKGIRMMARPWQPQDLLDDLQLLIDEEPDRYLNDRRTTLCMARDFLKEHFAEDDSLANEKQAISDWISVKDQRPEYKTRVLFVDESKRVWLAKDSVDWPDGGVSFFEPESGLWVRGTHWMPLPKLPKEVLKDDERNAVSGV